MLMLNHVMCSGGEPRAGDGGARNADGEAERGEKGGGQAASAAGGTGTAGTREQCTPERIKQ